MNYVSTRGASPPLRFSAALQQSLAPDGGLYVPERFPRFAPSDFDGLDGVAQVAPRLLAPLLEADPLAEALPAICAAAFDFPIPLDFGPDGRVVLELFHGPTAAFKDVGARFLAECAARLPAEGRRTVLVATSGDTGGAVAAAFHGKPGIDVVVLFPKGRVSPRQQQQLTCHGDNVRAFAVRGDFDDCQRMVKQAFADAEMRARHGLVSANSINIGRLLPQAAYYAAASLAYQRRTGRPCGFVVPTGNLGNAVAALWARAMGLPIGVVALATNANRTLVDLFERGELRPRPTVATLANAMDVGNPSNAERLLHLYPDRARLLAEVRARSVSDDEIRAEIVASARAGRVVCPHTAVALRVRRDLPGEDWVVVATAHPAKFETIVEPLVGRPVAVPPALAALLARPSRCAELAPDVAALRAAL
jgi:threonine synthase